MYTRGRIGGEFVGLTFWRNNCYWYLSALLCLKTCLRENIIIEEMNNEYGILMNKYLQWTNYVVNVSNIVVWPDYPRFPGPIFFNVTMDVSEELPQDKIEMDVEVSLVVYGTNLRLLPETAQFYWLFETIISNWSFTDSNIFKFSQMLTKRYE